MGNHYFPVMDQSIKGFFNLLVCTSKFIEPFANDLMLSYLFTFLIKVIKEKI